MLIDDKLLSVGLFLGHGQGQGLLDDALVLSGVGCGATIPTYNFCFVLDYVVWLFELGSG